MMKNISKNKCTLDIRKLTKKYTKHKIEFFALQDITLQAYNKNVTVILGPRESGKSTLFNCLIGYEIPTSGYVYFDEINIYSLNIQERQNFLMKNIGKIYSRFNLIDYLTVLENLFIKSDIHGIKDKSSNINFVLELLDLISIKNETIENLNNLDVALVALAKEIIIKPRFLFLDEPDITLNSQEKKLFFNKLQQLTNEFDLTTIYFTSDITVSTKANKIFRLDSGKIL